MARQPRLFAIALFIAGAAAAAGDGGWAYTGPDQKLRYPPVVFPGKDTSAEEVKRLNQEALDAWQAQRGAIVDAERQACAREAGSDRSGAFMACMKSRGWIRTGSPL